MIIRGTAKSLLAVILFGMIAAACSDGVAPSRRGRFADGTVKKNPDKSLDPANHSDGMPSPKKKPPPREPDSSPTKDDAPIDAGTGSMGNQMLSPADVYCSNDTVKYNGNLSFLNSQNIQFRFYDDANNIYSSQDYISTEEMRSIFNQTDMVEMPYFIGLPDGKYDLLFCESSKMSTCYVDFNEIFEFTPYEAVYYGKARGLVGIIRKVQVKDGVFVQFDKLSLIYPATGHSSTCTTETQ